MLMTLPNEGCCQRKNLTTKDLCNTKILCNIVQAIYLVSFKKYNEGTKNYLSVATKKKIK